MAEEQPQAECTMNQEAIQEEQIPNKVVDSTAAPPGTATANNEEGTTSGKERGETDDTTEKGELDVREGTQNTITEQDECPPSMINSKSEPLHRVASLSAWAPNPPTQSVHQEIVNNDSIDPPANASDIREAAVPSGQVMEEASPQIPPAAEAPPAAISLSTSPPPPNSTAEPNIDEANVQARESMISEATEETLNMAEGMEVDEIITGSSSNNQEGVQKSDASESDKKNDDIMERRTSKRQRTSSSSVGDSGEEVASKKPKVDNGSGAAEQGTAGEDVAPTVAASTAPSAVNIGGAGINGGTDGKKNAMDDKVYQEKGGSTPKPAPREWSEPSYRWIVEGTNSDATPFGVAEHQGVEIDFTNSKTNNWTPPQPFVVRPGDIVLISSGDAPWDDVTQQRTPGAKREIVSMYNDPASKEAGLGALDPYIGYVEGLWEEGEDPSNKGTGQRKRKGKSAKSAASSRMMIRTRWFLKKEELVALKGSFSVKGAKGTVFKDKVLATMASQDLVLTDQSDDNVVSTILGKIQVIQKKPLARAGDKSDVNVPKGALICRYDLNFCRFSSGKEGMVKLIPYTDDTSESDGSFKVGTGNGLKRGSSQDIASSEPVSTDEDGYSSDKQRVITNYAASYSQLQYPMSPRRVISEGPTVGKIKVGPDYQAVIPPQLDLQKKTSFRGLDQREAPSQRIPLMVWDPATDEGDAVDGFLDEACALLMNHMQTLELKPYHDVNYVESPNNLAEAKRPREANICCLLTELHECRGDVGKAIKKISANPESYITLWDKDDKEKFDTGFRLYRDSIRMIANTLGDSKSCMDAVDYQYRFKLIENFRRFKMKKREKAEEIMTNVEDRMMNEKVKAEAKADAKSQDTMETEASSSDEEDGKPSAEMASDNKVSNLTAMPATHATGPVNNRIRTWFKTGGGDESAVGATQQRRNRACDLLSRVAETVGKDAYATLAKSLKSCNSSQENNNNSLSDVEATANDILKSHPDLLEQFITFLPKQVKVRSN